MDLQENFKFFEKNRDGLVAKYKGKFIVISSCKVISVHDSFVDGAVSARKKYNDGEYIVKHCIAKEDEKPINFYSRVGVKEQV